MTTAVDSIYHPLRLYNCRRNCKKYNVSLCAVVLKGLKMRLLQKWEMATVVKKWGKEGERECVWGRLLLNWKRTSVVLGEGDS